MGDRAAPAATELDLWQGRALVSVVGFRFLGTRVLGLPVPLHSDFDEVNLRFYVRRVAEDGTLRRAVVFIRELVPRHAIAAVARWLYNEPYLTVRMGHAIDLDPHTGFQSADPQCVSTAMGEIAPEDRLPSLLIVGALTRIVGLGVLIEQILIIAYTNWYKWPPTLLNADGTYKGGYEYNVAIGLLGLLLCVMGGGAVSIDRLFRRKKPIEEDDDSYADNLTAGAAT